MMSFSPVVCFLEFSTRIFAQVLAAVVVLDHLNRPDLIRVDYSSIRFNARTVVIWNALVAWADLLNLLGFVLI